MKTELLNEYAKLRAMDWFIAGDVTLDRMSWAFDKLRKIYSNLTIKELRDQIAAVKERHNREGVVVL